MRQLARNSFATTHANSILVFQQPTAIVAARPLPPSYCICPSYSRRSFVSVNCAPIVKEPGATLFGLEIRDGCLEDNCQCLTLIGMPHDPYNHSRMPHCMQGLHPILRSPATAVELASPDLQPISPISPVPTQLYPSAPRIKHHSLRKKHIAK